MRKILNYILARSSSFFGTSKLEIIHRDLSRLKELVENVFVDQYLKDNLFSNVRYTSSKRITHFHNSVFSQNGEDGIIKEIFHRIGTRNKFFVEFGAHGIKNNTTYLLLKSWKGIWLEANSDGVKYLQKKFAPQIQDASLKVVQSLVTPNNIESLFQSAGVSQEFDLLSIDVDGMDYWLWKALVNFKPRVLVIEYNATIPFEDELVVPYQSDYHWNGTSYFGASLKSLEILGKEKGYSLVGCDFAGCNAFFVRNDIDLNLFESPFTAQNHYEAPKYFIRKSSGHTPGFGLFTKP